MSDNVESADWQPMVRQPVTDDTAEVYFDEENLDFLLRVDRWSHRYVRIRNRPPREERNVQVESPSLPPAAGMTSCRASHPGNNSGESSLTSVNSSSSDGGLPAILDEFHEEERHDPLISSSSHSIMGATGIESPTPPSASCSSRYTGKEAARPIMSDSGFISAATRRMLSQRAAEIGQSASASSGLPGRDTVQKYRYPPSALVLGGSDQQDLHRLYGCAVKVTFDDGDTSLDHCMVRRNSTRLCVLVGQILAEEKYAQYMLGHELRIKCFSSRHQEPLKANDYVQGDVTISFC